MAIPSSDHASDHANDTLAANSETLTGDSLPGGVMSVSGQADRSRKPPSSSRAGFVPIAQDEGTDADRSTRAIVLASEISATAPATSTTPATPATPATSEDFDNPFNADAFDWGCLDPLDASDPLKGTETPNSALPPLPPFASTSPPVSRPQRPQPTVASPAVDPPLRSSNSHDSPIQPPASPAGETWRNAGRADQWTRLKGLQAGYLRRRELMAALILYGLISILLHGFMQGSNEALLAIGLRPLQAFYLDHGRTIAIGLGGLALISPFLLDRLLAQRYHATPLTHRRLTQISPEAARLLTRFAQHKKRTQPVLYTLKSPAAFVWAYGYGQKSLRLVISSGAIETLTAEEIAIEVAAGIATAVQCDVFFATASVALLQLPYLVYDGLTQIGDRCQQWTQHDRPAQWGFDRSSARILAAEVGLWIVATIATLAYGVYRLLRLPLLAWSRLRQTYADRFAANLTGNPNARARSLAKQTLTQRREFDRSQGLSTLCERFELLGAVNPRHGLWCGANLEQPPIERFAWDAMTPHSTWLAIGDAHPPLGQRLERLARLAQHFNLDPEFSPDQFRRDPKAPRRPRTPTRQLPIAPASLLESSELMQNMTPLIGIVAACGLVTLAASLGIVGQIFQWRSLSWLQADWPWLMLGFALEGFAIGTVLRINAFFPDFKPYALNADPDLDRWILDPDSLPIDSRTLRLSGILVGRRSVGNWFGQDLWLDDGSTLWPIHYLDRTGWLGWLLPTHDRVVRFIGQPVTVTGWFRRGVTPWIDVDRLTPNAPSRSIVPKRQTKQPTRTIDSPQNGHPLWSTTLASLCAVWGAVILAKGGL